MKLSILPVSLSTCVVLVVVNSFTFVDGKLIKCQSLSKTNCDTEGDGICIWKQKKCKTKCKLFKGDDSKKCEQVKGCKLTSSDVCKKKPPKGECPDLNMKSCGMRNDCDIFDYDDDAPPTCENTKCENLRDRKCEKRDDCVLYFTDYESGDTGCEERIVECGELNTEMCGMRLDCVINDSTCAKKCDNLDTFPVGTSMCDERDDCVTFMDCNSNSCTRMCRNNDGSSFPIN